MGVAFIKFQFLFQCFSDISASRAKILNVHFPAVLGHEAAGIVESVGEGVESVKVGDHVITLFLPQCKNCRICKRNDANACLEFTSGTQSRQLLGDETTRISCKGKQLLQFLGVSAFSEYTVVKEFNLTKINPAAPLDIVCLLSCGFPTGLCLKFLQSIKFLTIINYFRVWRFSKDSSSQVRFSLCCLGSWRNWSCHSSRLQASWSKNYHRN